jgi:L-ascorbate metabolism protein UlaG (beta-lactamase superfamily)
MKVTYIGHAGFMVEMGDKRLLFDPWIDGNEKAAFTLDGVKAMDPDLIFVSHGHRDHGFNEAILLTRDSEAKAIGTFELINVLMEKGGKGIGANIGGRFIVDGVEVYLTSAVHSCPFGTPCGFVVSYDGKTIYHAGDTALTKDMELLPELFELDLALLPAGGHFTMGPKELSLAKEMLKPKHCIAMHHGTFPAIEQDMSQLEGIAEHMAPGQERVF